MNDWTSGGSGPARATPGVVKICVMTTTPSSTSPFATSSATTSVSGRTVFGASAVEMPRRSTRASMCRPLPTRRYAIERAFSSARLSASTEPMSGAGACSRTATPIPDRARSVRVVATIRPCRIHCSSGAETVMSTSNGSSARARRSKPFGRSLATTSAYPVRRSNSVPTSASTVANARAVQTRTSPRLDFDSSAEAWSHAPRVAAMIAADTARQRMSIVYESRRAKSREFAEIVVGLVRETGPAGPSVRRRAAARRGWSGSARRRWGGWAPPAAARRRAGPRS